MRHVAGVLLAVVMAAALFFAATWGFTHLTNAHGTGLTSSHGLAAVGAMLGTGLLLGLFLSVRWVSPLATGLPGLVLLGWTGLAVVKAQDALRYVPLKGHVFGSTWQTLLLNGVLALLGMAMIIPLFVPSRWHRYSDADAEIEEDLASVPASSTTSLLS